MQVQGMGTHCQVSSQFIKKDLQFFGRVPFSPQEGLEPGSLDPEPSALPLSYLAVDISLGFTVLYICNMAAISLYIETLWRPFLKAVKAIKSPKIKGRTALIKIR